jgi:hypothetical protein
LAGRVTVGSRVVVVVVVEGFLWTVVRLPFLFVMTVGTRWFRFRLIL